MRVQTRQPTKLPFKMHALAEVLARRDFRWNRETGYGVIGPYELTNFVAEFYLLVQPSLSNQYVLDSDSNGINRPYFLVNSGGIVSTPAETQFTVDGLPQSASLFDNKFHKIRFSGQGLFNLGMLNSRHTANETLQGMVFNLKVWSEGDLVVDMPLTKYLPNPNIIENKAKPLGTELWIDPTLNGWIDNGDDSYSLSGDGTFQNLVVPSGITAGVYYLVTFNVLAINGSMKIQSSSSVYGFSTTGVHTVLVEATAGLIGFARNSGAVNCTISNPSIRKAEGWGQYINPMPEDWGKGPFELQWNGDWLGLELVVNGGFYDASDWTPQSRWSLSNGKAVLSGEGSGAYLYQTGVAKIGTLIKVQFFVADVVGQVYLSIANGGSSYAIVEGFNTFEGIITENETLYFGGAAGATCEIDNVSVKEVLKSA